MGLQGDILSDAVRRSAMQRTGQRGRMARIRSDAKTPEKWNTYCVLMMPDHVHLLTAPLERELSVAAFLKWLKRWFNDVYELPEKCEWQAGGFDRLLRTSESIHEKWQYIRENPVRAGLVEHWNQWPYRSGFFDDEI
jgi:putative transposase